MKELQGKLAEVIANLNSKVNKKPDIWFDDVDEMLLEPEDRVQSTSTYKMLQIRSGELKSNGLIKETGFKG